MRAKVVLKRVQYVTIGVEYSTEEEKENMDSLALNMEDDVDDSDWETDTSSVASIEFEEDLDENQKRYFDRDYQFEVKDRQFVASDYPDEDDEDWDNDDWEGEDEEEV